MFRSLGGLIMAVLITHATPADATFSPSGAGAWNTSHAILNLATVAESGAYSNLTGAPVLAAVATSGAYSSLSGTPTIITLSQVYPVGSVYVETLGVNPSTTFGFGTWAAKGSGKVLVGFSTGSTEFGTTGQTGGSTGTSFTPSGTNAVVQFTPAGTNAVSLFRDAAAGTNAVSQVTGSVSVDWPGVPTFQGTAVTVTSSVNWPSVPTFQGTAVTASASVNWPSVPTFAGTSHRHELPIIHTDNTVLRFLPTATFGVGATSRVPDVRATVTNVLVADVANSGVVMLSNTVTAAGVISWPASVPQAVVSSSAAGVITWPASVPQAMASISAAGIISWPATTPNALAKTLTAAAQVFTGVTGSVSAQVFTGVTGTVSGQTFTGVTKSVAVLPPYIVVFFWERTA